MTNITSTIQVPTPAVVVDEWQEVNGEVCRYFHEADHPIPDIPGAYYGFTARQRTDGSVADREMYVNIPADVFSEADMRSIVEALSEGLSDLLSEAAPGGGASTLFRREERR
jgi:hypothetical protein